MPATRRSASRIRNSIARSVGFTLVELLVVIGIIVVLIGILLPVVSRVRLSAQTADSRNFISELSGAIERYNTDFRAYPGPLSNDEIQSSPSPYTSSTNFHTFLPVTVAGYDTSQGANAAMKFTMSENLVLALLGGLRVNTTTTTELDYDPSAVGTGPNSLSTAGLPKKYPPYLDVKGLSWQNTPNGKTGHYYDAAGDADDSIIPEFVDRYTDAMPILYLRAKVGATVNPPYRNTSNPIITNGTPPRPGAYDISQIIAYTGTYTGVWPNLTQDIASPPTGKSIGVGKSLKASAYLIAGGSAEFGSGVQVDLHHGLKTVSISSTTSAPYPYDAYPYFQGSAGGARQKDGFILISAGPDRVYGTKDDLCSFGNVGE